MKKNWQAVKADFISSSLGLRTLAKKHGCSFHSLAKVCRREDWLLAKRLAERAEATGEVTPLATPTATADFQPATVAPIELSMNLHAKSASLRTQICNELQRDLNVVKSTQPKGLLDSEKRQSVLSSVTNVAKVCLDWGNRVEPPCVRIDVMSAITIHQPEQPESPPPTIDITAISDATPAANNNDPIKDNEHEQ